jgi:hypothetical protein
MILCNFTVSIAIDSGVETTLINDLSIKGNNRGDIRKA